jgi:maltose/moltooligosaccharide transporter
MEKKRLNFGGIWNMCFGFFGIQFGWALQMGNMGPIYEYLGAKPDEIPFLFLAAPLTGLLVQPIIGYMSDRTWHPILGRRRPYFLVGAILSSICLCMMPNSSAIWMAAGTLWILDSSINISMEPFRAFVADKLPDEQRATGFAMQSFFIGLGSFIAGYLPSWLADYAGMSRIADGGVPENIRFSFYVGAAAFFTAVLYTVLTSKEYPPADIPAREKVGEIKKGFGAGFREISHAVMNMPDRMKKLALIQFLTWPGLFLMWFYYSTAVARNVFHAPDEQSELYTIGVEFANKTMAFYNMVTFLVAFTLPVLAKYIGRNITHMICLFCGGLGLLSVSFIHEPNMLYLSMTGVGIAWASILSMPYSMLAGAIPEEKMGIYMGIFNFFIVLPEIIASLSFGYIMDHWLNNNRLSAVMIGGILMIIAGILCLRVRDQGRRAMQAAQAV